MTTIDELKGRVDHMGDVMDRLATNLNILTDLVINQRQEMAEMRLQTAELQRQTAELRLQTAELRIMSESAHKRLDNHDELLAEMKQQTAEIKRDGQKTRRLWIAIARKLDWLDLDEDFD